MSSNEVWSEFWKQKDHSFRAVSDVEYFRPEDDPPYIVLERLSNPKINQTIVEVGSGAGVRTLVLAKRYNLIPMLIDNEDEGISLAKRNATLLDIEVNIIKSDIFQVQTDNQFDIVWSHGVGEHFDGEKRQKYFDILGELVKNEGILIISVSNSFNLPFMIGMNIRKKLGTWIYGFEKPFSPFELYNRVKASNLRIIEKTGYEFFQSFNWICYYYRIIKKIKLLYKIIRKLDFKDHFINRYFGREIVVSCKKNIGKEL
ncbi:MAG: hypothetical protein COS27_08405 [Nitrospirae bacterium CG02_land_8_20_14_3_00_41_53]|nr:MAG: hypothetical protein COV68_04960 [Nitrospirae bacterium CG11_big_fil_rev_8_21_14_0_20_41_14]PIV41905.1 MAG: hypothetical protein COS27_08405 [Nitrospirae bacterium CG02_land_8_20_14_3_00_41_53]PIW86637.1 MAG: hypothetical protein COZ94_09345 [Nitrospirae bacterium CG_4_8_14_3_um_filter_41_47]